MGGMKKQKQKMVTSVFKPWKLAIVFVLLLFVSATLLRFDNLKMTQLRDAVIAADKEGGDQKITDALNKLRDFTTTHIIFNTLENNGERKIIFGTGPMYLEQSYIRKAQAEIARAQEALDQEGDGSNPNGNVYKKVAKTCDALSRKYGWGFNQSYINCFQENLAKYGASSELTLDKYANLPSPELYRYDFVSPVWCPCLSGIIILICALLAVYLVIRFLIWIVLSIVIFVAERI